MSFVDHLACVLANMFKSLVASYESKAEALHSLRYTFPRSRIGSWHRHCRPQGLRHGHLYSPKTSKSHKTSHSSLIISVAPRYQMKQEASRQQEALGFLKTNMIGMANYQTLRFSSVCLPSGFGLLIKHTPIYSIPGTRWSTKNLWASQSQKANRQTKTAKFDLRSRPANYGVFDTRGTYSSSSVCSMFFFPFFFQCFCSV